MSFTTTELTGDRVLVKGTDQSNTTGQTVLDATQWNQVNADKRYSQAATDFDAAVEEFFAPLMAAAEKLDQDVTRPDDPTSYVVLEEAVEGVAPKAGNLVRLNHDSIVLRIIESGDTDRLVWVGDDLEVAAVKPAVVASAPDDTI